MKNIYPNSTASFNYTNIENEINSISKNNHINSDISLSGNPYFTRHDYPMPVGIGSPSNYYSAKNAPICDYNDNLYFPLTITYNVGWMKFNINTPSDTTFLFHPTIVDYNGDTSVVNCENFTLTPNGQMIGIFSPARSGTPTQSYYIDTRNKDVEKILPYSFTVGFNEILYPYSNGVYNSNHNCVYMMPTGDRFGTTDNKTIWHRINLNTGSPVLETYTSALLTSNTDLWNAKYKFGVATKNNRIFLIPFNWVLSTTSTKCHYIDCSGATPVLTEYLHGVDISNTIYSTATYGTYSGGVYIPELDRIYLIPSQQLTHTSKYLHYIQNCSTTPSVVTYQHTIDISEFNNTTGSTYSGGIYLGDGLIFMVPIYQSTKDKFHLIDTKTNNLLSYNTFLYNDTYNEKIANFLVGATLVRDRIYFSYGTGTKLSNQTTWFYLALNNNQQFSERITKHSLKLNT